MALFVLCALLLVSTVEDVASPLRPVMATHSALKTPTPEAESRSMGALLATESLFQLQHLTSHNGSVEELQSDVIRELPEHLETVCGYETVNCSAIDGHFRTMNGSCNNLLHPLWGSGVCNSAGEHYRMMANRLNANTG